MAHVETAVSTRTETSLRSRVQSLLAEEGYRPNAVEGDFPHLVFKADGKTVVARFAEGDEQFVHFSMGFMLGAATRDELELRRAANQMQAELKAVKVYLPDDPESVEFQVELLLPGTGLQADVLERSLGVLREAAGTFFARVAPPMPKARA